MEIISKPYLCLFINADAVLGSLGNLLGDNVYAYCENNPVIAYDPTGYCLEEWALNACGGGSESLSEEVGSGEVFESDGESKISEESTGELDYKNELRKEQNAEIRKLQLEKNRIQGEKFENEITQKISTTNKNVVKQVTVKTKSGVKTRLDIMSNDSKTGKLKIIEAKSSATAPLTVNQKLAFPEIMKFGGIVVGKGKYPFVGGTEIPPTEIEIFRP